MKDYLENWDKLHTHAAVCALIRDLATDPEKRAMFDQLAQHLKQLADEVGGRRIAPTSFELRQIPAG